MECAICHTDRNCSLMLTENHRHPNYWKCGRCGLIFAHPQRDYNYAGECHPEDFHWSEDRIGIRIANYALRYDLFKEYLPSTSPRLLDVGAFNGVFLHYMQTLGIRCLGVEMNRDAAEFGRTRFNVPIVLTSFEEFAAREEYDIITMFNVLEHMRNFDGILRKVGDLLHAGGIFVCEIPNVFHWVAAVCKGRWHHYEDGHNWLFGKNTISMVLKKHGFIVDRVSYVPKVASLAKAFDSSMFVLGIYKTYRFKRKIQSYPFYSALEKKRFRFSIHDHILAVAHKPY